MNTLTNKIVRALTAIVLSAVLFLAQAPIAQAARLNSISDLDRARVSFTFDDGFASTRTLAAPILEAHGIDGVLYLTSGVPDGTATLDDNQPGITWDQVRELQNVYGWEIGGHTVDHAEMPTITREQNVAELANSNAAFKANGLNVTNFASPFGAYDTMTLTEILKLYKSHRGFADRDALNSNPLHKDILMVQDVNDATTSAQVQAWVDQAITEKRWLILVFHDTATKKNPNYEYTVTTANLTTMASYVQTKVNAGQIQVVTTEQGITIPGVNILQNSGFENGLADGWTTDNAAGVAADNGNNGNYGSPVQSINLTGTATEGHLFSGNVQVSYNSSYVLDAFVNSLGLTSGELGFYVDEYDANGNWTSGQWLGMVTNGTIGFFTKLYNATSELVNTIRVQTYLTAGATGTAYVDSVQVYNLDGTPAPTTSVTPTPTASVSGTPTPTPAATNVITNGSFDQGISNGWTTDKPANVVADANGGQNAVKFTGTTTASHLFYNLNAIDTTATYLLSSTVNANGLTSGELGFYIDEYNAAGTWISGQWLGNVSNGVTSTFQKAYKATSNLVARIGIQTYMAANSNGTAYVDNYSLTGPAVATPTPAATNVITNGSFDQGISNGWTTDKPANVVADANGGQNAVKFTGTTTASHLFYNLNAIDTTATYLLKATADATAVTSGELGFYIDEYDINGTWISGQWLGSVVNGAVTSIEKTYKATSALVSRIGIQTYMAANSNGTAFVDNYSMTNTAAPTGTVSPTPTVTPTSTVTPTPTTTPVVTNLIPNGSFETVAGGFASNWTHDTGDVTTIDTTSKGNNGANSLFIPANTAYAHAFSSSVSVDSTKTYTWTQYIMALAGTGEFGFYIDEYDAAGTWVSGQWKGMVNGASTGTKTFSYTPTSATVKSVRLQYYKTPNSTFPIYIDSVSLSAN